MIELIHKVITLFKYISAYSNLTKGKITDVDLKRIFDLTKVILTNLMTSILCIALMDSISR